MQKKDSLLALASLLFVTGCAIEPTIIIEQRDTMKTIKIFPAQADTIAAPMKSYTDNTSGFIATPIGKGHGVPREKGALEAGFAAFKFEAGRYSFFGSFYWTDGASNSFWIKIDTMDYEVFGNDGETGKWILYPGPVVPLDKGLHTTRIQEREWGARFASLIVTQAPEYITDESELTDDGFVTRDPLTLLVYPEICIDSSVAFSLFYSDHKNPGGVVRCTVSNDRGKDIYAGNLTSEKEAACTMLNPKDGVYTIRVGGFTREFERAYDRFKKIQSAFIRYKQRQKLSEAERFWLPTLHLCIENIRRGWYVEHQQDTKRLVTREYVRQEFDFAERIIAAFATNNFTGLATPGVREMAFYSAEDDTLCPYRLYMPEAYFSRALEKYPLVLFLHGSNNTQYEVERDARYYKRSMDEITVPVVVPSARGNYHYVDVVEKDIIQMLRSLVSYYRIDSTKLAVTGFSMGGMGTWNFVFDYPGMFDAAVANAGALTWEFNKESLNKEMPKQLPRTIIILHSPQDFTVPFSYAESVAKQLKKRGHPFTFISYDGGHVTYPGLIDVFNGLWSTESDQ